MAPRGEEGSGPGHAALLRAPAEAAVAPVAVAPPRARLGPVLMIIAAMAAFSTQDLVVKVVAAEVSLWQLQLIRSLLVLWLLLLLVAAVGHLSYLAPRAWKWPVMRAVFMSGAYLCFYAALPLLPLSQAAAAFFTGPLFITLLAALVLGEPIGPRRVVAVLAGFAGVLLIIRPGFAGWRVEALLPVLSAFCYAAGMVITRWRCGGETNFALSAIHNALYALIGLAGVVILELFPVEPSARAAWPFLFSGWLPLGGLAAALILITACTHLAGVLLSVRAYQSEEASRIAPFEYSYLAIMALYDLLLWGVVPDLATFAGMVLIAGAGTFVAWREGRPPRPQIHPRGEIPWTDDEGYGKGGK